VSSSRIEIPVAAMDDRQQRPEDMYRVRAVDPASLPRSIDHASQASAPSAMDTHVQYDANTARNAIIAPWLTGAGRPFGR